MSISSTTEGPVEPREQIGLVGLGLMGSAIAERLLRSGFGVLGYDIRPEALEAAEQIGVRRAAGVNEIAAQCQRIVFSLYDSASVENVIGEMRNGLGAGQIIVDTTTQGVENAEGSGRSLSTSGVEYLDATISGNRDQLLKGEVTVFAGGSKQAFKQCEDLFRLFAAESLHVGDCGAGAKMKLVTNLVLGLNRAALAEGLVFAESLGIASPQALEALRASMAYSRIMDSKGPKMVQRDFTVQARLSQHLKDLRIILAAAKQAGLELPLSRVHQQILEGAEAAGLGELDNSALIQVLERKAQNT